jgi:hypothetical protein
MLLRVVGSLRALVFVLALVSGSREKRSEMGHEGSCAAPGRPERTLEAQQHHDTFRNRDPGDHGTPTYFLPVCKTL